MQRLVQFLISLPFETSLAVNGQRASSRESLWTDKQTAARSRGGACVSGESQSLFHRLWRGREREREEIRTNKQFLSLSLSLSLSLFLSFSFSLFLFFSFSLFLFFSFSLSPKVLLTMIHLSFSLLSPSQRCRALLTVYVHVGFQLACHVRFAH